MKAKNFRRKFRSIMFVNYILWGTFYYHRISRRYTTNSIRRKITEWEKF